MRTPFSRFFDFKLSLLLLVLTAGHPAHAGLDWVKFTSLPGRAIGKLVTPYLNCTAFLSGPQQITTAAHCLKYGIAGATFQLHYDNSRYADSAMVTDVLTSGGGIDPDDQLRGFDWVHIRIDKALGDTYGYLELWDEDVPTGMEIQALGYGNSKEWINGAFARVSTCKVEDPPSHTQRFCRKLPDGQYSCSFFTHECETDEKGGGSGGPIVAKIDKGEHKGDWMVVGIHTGQGRIGGKDVAGKVFNWAGTVNESSIPAANVYLHWLAMLNYNAFDAVAQKVAGKYYSTTVDKNHSMEQRVREMFHNWNRKTVATRFADIQAWDSAKAQKSALAMVTQFKTQAAEQARYNPIRFKIETTSRDYYNVTEGKQKFGVFYADAKPVGHMPLVANLPLPGKPSKGNSLEEDARRTMELLALSEAIKASKRTDDPLLKQLSQQVVSEASSMKDRLELWRQQAYAQLQRQQYVQPTQGYQIQYYQVPVYYTVPTVQYYLVPVQPQIILWR